MARHLRDPNAPGAHESFGILRRFIDRVKASGVPSGAVMFPALYGLEPRNGSYPFDYLNEQVAILNRFEREWQRERTLAVSRQATMHRLASTSTKGSP